MDGDRSRQLAAHGQGARKQLSALLHHTGGDDPADRQARADHVPGRAEGTTGDLDQVGLVPEGQFDGQKIVLAEPATA